MGPKLNALKGRDQLARWRPRKRRWKTLALDARLQRAEWLDVTLPARDMRHSGSIHPISQVTEEVTAIFADMGFAVAEGPQIESDWHNFRRAQHPRPPPGAGRDGHVLYAPRGGRQSPATCAAHPYLASADPLDGERAGAPIRVICPGRVYRADYDSDPHADVPSGRGAGAGHRYLDGQPEMGAGGIRQGVLRGR